MPFTPADFHDLVDSDIWVLEQMLTLPSDPEPVITKTDTEIRVELFDTVGMSAMQNAVRDFRARLLPAIIVVAQKVYAELFRVVLSSAGQTAGARQFDIQTALQPLLGAGTIAAFHPFKDSAHISSWWNGRYNFDRLRRARNQIAHGRYTFVGGRLAVIDDSGTLLLDWSENQILEFAAAVVDLAKRT